MRHHANGRCRKKRISASTDGKRREADIQSANLLQICEEVGNRVRLPTADSGCCLCDGRQISER